MSTTTTHQATGAQRRDEGSQNRNEMSWSSDSSRGGTNFAASAHMPETGLSNMTGLGIPGFAGVGLLGLPMITWGQVMMATQQAALAQVLHFLTANVVEHQLAITKQIADRLCPPLNSGQGQNQGQDQYTSKARINT